VSAFDLIVRNAKIVDGTGSPWRWGDVGITDRKIEAIGKIPEGTPCGMEVNAGGEVLAPGFIDIHTHNDFLLLKDATSSPKLKQGITTIMIGQCGISAATIPNAITLFPLGSSSLQFDDFGGSSLQFDDFAKTEDHIIDKVKHA
jgi:N-acyl-D-amino-acid deacylase